MKLWQELYQVDNNVSYSPWCLNLDHLELNKLYNEAFNCILYLPVYNVHPDFEACFQKKVSQCPFFTTIINNSTVVISNLALPAWNSITRFDANYLMFWLFGDRLSLMMFFFVFFWCSLLLYNQTWSICATPITFLIFERGDLKQTRHLLATWQDSRFKMAENNCTIFSLPNLSTFVQ